MMVKRPRCRSCERRIWPWQPSGGTGVMGAKDNDPERCWMRHLSCVERDVRARRLAAWEAREPHHDLG
jgi:hypothetical protein